MGADKNSSLWLNSAYTPIATPRTHTHKQDHKQGSNNLKGTTKKPRDKKRKQTNKNRSTSSELQKPGRTVHVGLADRPRRGHGPSGHHTRTVQKALQTNRAAPQKIGLSVIEPRTVRTENILADCLRVSRGPSANHVQNGKQKPID
jgi:hypothetical protein